MGTLPDAAIPPVEEHLLSCSLCQSRLVETDDFVVHFRAAATQVELHTATFWQRFLSAQRFVWGGSAAVAAGLVLLMVSGEPRLSKEQPAIVLMQSLRGPEEQVQIAKRSPSLLIFDVAIPATHPSYEVEVVDTAGKPVLKGQIICSCPITDASSGSAQGYQILGPYPCDRSFFKYCKSDVANGKTGSTIYVGAPIGTAAALTALLTGKAAPPFNECGSE